MSLLSNSRLVLHAEGTDGAPVGRERMSSGFTRSQREPAGRARGRAVLELRRERHSAMPARPASAAATTYQVPSGPLAWRPGPPGSGRWCRSLEAFLLACPLSRDLDFLVFLRIN